MVTARIEIRTATLADAPLLSELGCRTFRDTFADDNTESDMAAYLAGAFSVDVQTRELTDPSSTFLIAQIGDTAAGYSRLRFGPAPPCICGVGPVEIVRFYSDSPWIGRGIGAALMTACLDEAVAHGCDVVWLDVWDRNERAIAFYSKWGFEIVGEADFVLGDDVQHDLLMARPTAGWPGDRTEGAGARLMDEMGRSSGSPLAEPRRSSEDRPPRRRRDHNADGAPNSEDAMPSRSELIDEMIAKTPGWRGETLAKLREVIHVADPDIVEDVKWRRPANPIGSAVFEHDGIVCVGVILKERVRLSFWDGARLPDPNSLFNAQLEGNKSRAIDFREGEDLREDDLIALIRAGVELNVAKPKPARKKH